MRLFNFPLRCWCVGLPLLAVVLAVLVNLCWAQAPSLTRIEEDWELVIGDPTSDSNAPQITCVMAPFGNVLSLYATFLVNYGNTPTSTAGGLQLQAWNGAILAATSRYPDQSILNTPGETIRWTQVMRTTPGGLVFEVVNGTSTTWGAFGANDSLKVTVANAPQNLNGYSPTISVDNSGVSFAANRVQSLVLKRVRAYVGNELIGTDPADRSVYPRQTIVAGE
jgi:hypothetical protein